MRDALQDIKTRNRLFAIIGITIPVLGILAGTPFKHFELQRFESFVPHILFISVINLFIWGINLLLLYFSTEVNILRLHIIRFLASSALVLLLCGLLFSFMKDIIPPPLPPRLDRLPPLAKMVPPPFFFIGQASRILTINIIIYIFSELIYLQYKKEMIESENEGLRQSNLEARINQLKLQMHPHFLFNSLNTLKLLLKKDPVRAEEFLIKLSDILRFSIANATESLVPLQTELSVCKDYLDMQKVRFGSMLYFTISPELYTLHEFNIPVFALQTLVENAIKHNAFTLEEPLHINIDYIASERKIHVSNNKKEKLYSEETEKIGLRNLNERYRLLEKEEIEVINSDNAFEVKLLVI